MTETDHKATNPQTQDHADRANPPPLKIGDSLLYNHNCLALLPSLTPDVIITDPVWPNCPAGLIPGSEDPDGLFRDFCELIPSTVRQIVIILRNDSDPRFLRHIPPNWPFQQLAWCQYVMPGYLGRILGGNECAYVFGKPVKSAPGRRVIPSISPKAQPSDRPPNGHPCSRALVHQRWLVKWFSEEWETVLDPFMRLGGDRRNVPHQEGMLCNVARLIRSGYFSSVPLKPICRYRLSEGVESGRIDD
jgi:site-specific DNA-methyltransferase (adenine-specific)